PSLSPHTPSSSHKLYMPSVDANIHYTSMNSNAIFSEFGRDVVSFLLDAQWPFPYISANEKAKKHDFPSLNG
ncbi:MAG: hypothetical protein AABZ85_05225, partial [Thermodesulfobacteriota bacterium]